MRLMSRHMLKSRILILVAIAGVSVAAWGEEVVVPIIGASNRPQTELKIPTGSEEFEVQCPEPRPQLPVSVAQFGASPDLPDNTKAFNDAIAHCAAVGAAKLIVPTGVYRFTKTESITFDKLTNFEFDGQGATFVYNHPSRHCMVITNCQQVLFKNFAVDWDWDNDPLASLVKVDNIEPTGAYADLCFVDYQRFPKRDIVMYGSLLAVDPATLSVGYREGGGLYFGTYGSMPKVEWISDNILRMYAGSTPHYGMGKEYFLKDVKKGGLYRLQHRIRGDGAVNLGNNVNLTLSGVNVYSCPGAAFYVWGDQHHWQALNTNVIRPPGTRRPATCLADHFDVAQTLGYFKMEGCEMSYGGDDCFCVIGGGAIASRSGSHAVRFKGPWNPNHFRVGDPIEFRQDDYAPTGFTDKIVSINIIDAKDEIREFVFEQVLPEQKGVTFILFNRHYSPKNIIIRNCYFHDNQARGALLKGENITLENCRFFHNQLGAIHVYSGYRLKDGADGCGAANIVIRNNLIDTANPDRRYEMSKMPAIYLFSYIRSCTGEAPLGSADKTKYPILRDILIEKNQFVDVPGVIVSVCSAGNVLIRDNTVKATRPQRHDQPFRGSIEIGFASDVAVIGNKWFRSPWMKVPGIYWDKTTAEGVSWIDNVLVDDGSH